MFKKSIHQINQPKIVTRKESNIISKAYKEYFNSFYSLKINKKLNIK